MDEPGDIDRTGADEDEGVDLSAEPTVDDTTMTTVTEPILRHLESTALSGG